MVSNTSIIYMFISLILSIFVPFGLIIFFKLKYKISLKSVLIGVLVFFVFQVLLRIPMITYLRQTSWYTINVASTPIILAIFLGLTAGLFEEGGRYLAFKFVLKKERKWKDGIAFGLGHAGIESVLLVGIAYISNIVISFLINSGTFSTESVQGLDILKNTLINTESYMFILGGIERLFVLSIHIGLTLIVLYGIRKGKKIYLLLAILLHTGIDMIAVLSKNILITEGIILLIAIGFLIFISKSMNLFKNDDVIPNEN